MAVVVWAEPSLRTAQVVASSSRKLIVDENAPELPVGADTMKNVPVVPAATTTDPFGVPPGQGDCVTVVHVLWSPKPAVVPAMRVTPDATPGPAAVGAVVPLLVNMLVIWNTMSLVVVLFTVSGTWSVLAVPQPFPVAPVFAQAPAKLITGGGGGGCDDAKAGA